jgi:hypothetical protein
MGPKFIIGVFSISAQPATSQLNLKLHFYRENLGKKIKKKLKFGVQIVRHQTPKKIPSDLLSFPDPLGGNHGRVGFRPGHQKTHNAQTDTKYLTDFRVSPCLTEAL